MARRMTLISPITLLGRKSTFKAAPDKRRVQFYEGTSYHVRPRYWKYGEKINMVLVDIDLEEERSDEKMGDVIAYVGRIPDEVFPNMPPRAVEFEGLTCPVQFDGVLALTCVPSKTMWGGHVFHYSPVTSFLFYVHQSDGGQRVVHQNLETISYKGSKFMYSFAPESQYLVTVFDERHHSQWKSRKTFRGTRVAEQVPILAEDEINDIDKAKMFGGDANGSNPRRIGKMLVQREKQRESLSIIAPALDMLQKGRGSILMPRCRTVVSRFYDVDRRVRASPLISGCGLQYTCKTIIHRDKGLEAEFRMINTDLPPGAPLVFLTRLKLFPCNEGDVTMDSFYVQMRTSRRVVIIMATHFRTAAKELYYGLLDDGAIKPTQLVFLIAFLGVVLGFFGPHLVGHGFVKS